MSASTPRRLSAGEYVELVHDGDAYRYDLPLSVVPCPDGTWSVTTGTHEGIYASRAEALAVAGVTSQILKRRYRAVHDLRNIDQYIVEHLGVVVAGPTFAVNWVVREGQRLAKERGLSLDDMRIVCVFSDGTRLPQVTLGEHIANDIEALARLHPDRLSVEGGVVKQRMEDGTVVFSPIASRKDVQRG